MMQISDEEDDDEDDEDTESSEDDVDSADEVEFNNPVALVALVEGTYISIFELKQYCFLAFKAYQFRRQPQPLQQISHSPLSHPIVVEIVSARKSDDLPPANRKMTKHPASVVETESSLNFVF